MCVWGVDGGKEQGKKEWYKTSEENQCLVSRRTHNMKVKRAVVGSMLLVRGVGDLGPCLERTFPGVRTAQRRV
jgi:hypothetical protein